MKKFIVLACLATTVSLGAGTAMAESIKGKLGITVKAGYVNPADNDSDFYHNKTDSSIIAGGGLLYGIDDHFAAELDLSWMSFGSETGDFDMTNVSIGGQYRFAMSDPKLVPYIGVGMDIIAAEYDPNFSSSRDVDTTIGAHLSGGIDIFLQKQLALTLEAKAVAADDTKITDSFGDHRGNFDPSSFSTTIGLRYFFN